MLKMKYMLIVSLLFILVGNKTSMQDEQLVTLTSNPSPAYVWISEIRQSGTPATMRLQPGDYSAQIMLAGYEPQIIEFTVSDKPLEFHIELLPDTSGAWQTVLHAASSHPMARTLLKPRGFQQIGEAYGIIVEVIDDKGEYNAIMLAADGTPVSPGYYVYNPDTQLLTPIAEESIAPRLSPEQLEAFDVTLWEGYDQAYVSISPDSQYAVVPRFEIGEFWLVDLITEQAVDIGIIAHTPRTQPGYRQYTAMWSEDGTSILIKDEIYFISHLIRILLNHTKGVESIKILDLFDFFDEQYENLFEIWFISASANHEMILFEVRKTGADDQYVVLDTRNNTIYELPIPFSNYARWHNNETLILMNFWELIEVRFPSLDIEIHNMYPIMALSDSGVEIFPDFSYIYLVRESPSGGYDFLIYDLGHFYSPVQQR